MHRMPSVCTGPRWLPCQRALHSCPRRGLRASAADGSAAAAAATADSDAAALQQEQQQERQPQGRQQQQQESQELVLEPLTSAHLERNAALVERLRGQLILAPLTRGNHLPFRKLCAELGATVTMSEVGAVIPRPLQLQLFERPAAAQLCPHLPAHTCGRPAGRPTDCCRWRLRASY